MYASASSRSSDTEYDDPKYRAWHLHYLGAPTTPASRKASCSRSADDTAPKCPLPQSRALTTGWSLVQVIETFITKCCATARTTIPSWNDPDRDLAACSRRVCQPASKNWSEGSLHWLAQQTRAVFSACRS